MTITAPKRPAILLGVIAVLAALLLAATPAAAKPAPPQPTQYYLVTISGSMDTGSAACTTGASLIMRDVNGDLVADGTLGTSVPKLLFEAAVPWSRVYPVPAGDPTGFHGCHGGPWPAGSTGSPGYLYLYRDGGTITGLMWAFDWYTGTVETGKRPKEVREYFRTWNTAPLLQGEPTAFTVRYYRPPVIADDEIGTAALTLTITAVPITP